MNDSFLVSLGLADGLIVSFDKTPSNERFKSRVFLSKNKVESFSIIYLSPVNNCFKTLCRKIRFSHMLSAASSSDLRDWDVSRFNWSSSSFIVGDGCASVLLPLDSESQKPMGPLHYYKTIKFPSK